MARTHPAARPAETRLKRKAAEKTLARVQFPAQWPACRSPGLHPAEAAGVGAHPDLEAAARDKEQGAALEPRAQGREMAQAPGPGRAKDRVQAMAWERVRRTSHALPGRKTVIFPPSCWALRPRKPIPKPWARWGEDWCIRSTCAWGQRKAGSCNTAFYAPPNRPSRQKAPRRPWTHPFRFSFSGRTWSSRRRWIT